MSSYSILHDPASHHQLNPSQRDHQLLFSFFDLFFHKLKPILCLKSNHTKHLRMWTLILNISISATSWRIDTHRWSLLKNRLCNRRNWHSAIGIWFHMTQRLRLYLWSQALSAVLCTSSTDQFQSFALQMDNQSVVWGFKHVVLPKEYSDKMLCLQDYNPKSQRPVSVYNVPSCFSGSNRNFTTICGESRQGKQPDAAGDGTNTTKGLWPGMNSCLHTI